MSELALEPNKQWTTWLRCTVLSHSTARGAAKRMMAIGGRKPRDTAELIESRYRSGRIGLAEYKALKNDLDLCLEARKRTVGQIVQIEKDNWIQIRNGFQKKTHIERLVDDDIDDKDVPQY